MTEVLTLPDSRVIAQLRLDVEREMELRVENWEREHASLKTILDTRMTNIDALMAERLASRLREDDIRETHRLELKADNQRQVDTAMIAAEKAVQAALMASEKARDQQTIASELAIAKAEKTSKEVVESQGETFARAIDGLSVSVNDLKGLVGELRAEKRGGQAEVVDRRATTTQVILGISLVASLFGGIVVALISRLLGG